MRDDQADRLIKVLGEIRDRFPRTGPMMFGYRIGSGEPAEWWQADLARRWLAGYFDTARERPALFVSWAQEIIAHVPEG